MREEMVQQQIINRGIKDQTVIEAMRKVPRHLFVPVQYQNLAYQDGPLPIGYEQTISQPFIVAYMTEKLQLHPHDKVLEIGTGSGYQAAILSEIVDSVFTIEIIEELALTSYQILKENQFNNVVCKWGDGYDGWAEHAPYNAIIVTAAPESIPQALLDQLAENGRLIIPIGQKDQTQYLKVIVKTNGRIKQKSLIPVRFVPFTHEDNNDYND